MLMVLLPREMSFREVPESEVVGRWACRRALLVAKDWDDFFFGLMVSSEFVKLPGLFLMKMGGKETKLTNAEPTGRETDADKNIVIFAAEKAEDFRKEWPLEI